MTRKRQFTLASVLALGIAFSAHAAVKTETIEYKDGDVTCKGYFAFDDAVRGARPGVILVHDWWGLGKLAKGNAERLAGLGYAAFALDMYGNGTLTDKVEEAQKMSGDSKKNPDKAKARFEAALAALTKRPEVDPKKVAALGYCFGGTTVLNMARLGEPLAGVVSFHGGLSTAVADDKSTPKAKVLVCHGADDPFVPAAEVESFKAEMAGRKADLQFVAYPGAVHSFTDPGADAHGMNGAKYNKAAEEKSWADMTAFLKKIFG